MTAYTARAEIQVTALRDHFEELGRTAATRALFAALDKAERRIDNGDAGLSAPRPYPRLVRPGRAWIKAGRYWISYSTTAPPVIVGVYFETANIPGRL